MEIPLHFISFQFTNKQTNKKKPIDKKHKFYKPQKKIFKYEIVFAVTC